MKNLRGAAGEGSVGLAGQISVNLSRFPQVREENLHLPCVSASTADGFMLGAKKSLPTLKS